MKTYKLLFLCIILVSFKVTHGCELKKPLVSLSGPVTTYIEELGLINELKAISIFHKIKNKEQFKGDVLGGGIHMANKTLRKISKYHIFFDSSKEFEKNLAHSKILNAIKLDTRGQDPFRVYKYVQTKVNPFLKNCSNKIKSLDKKINLIYKKFKNMNLSQSNAIFYLGSCEKRKPSLLIVNDGIVKYLIEKMKLNSYPSPLAYVTWSQKIMSTLKKKGFLEICLDTKAGKNEFIVDKKTPLLWQVGYGDLFNPGLSQIYFLEKFIPLLSAGP
jgi:hypothetical protein